MDSCLHLLPHLCRERIFDAASSWLPPAGGAYWGERGYIRVQMKGDGAGPCGMYQYAYLPPSTFVSSPLV